MAKKAKTAKKAAKTRPAHRESATKVRDYFDLLPAEARKQLNAMRAAIRAVAPNATDHFSYGVPGYRFADNKPFVYYAAFKNHVSLYPIGEAIRRGFAAALKNYETSTGTVRFPLDAPLPTALVKRLVKARMSEMRQAAARKAKSRR